MHHISVTVSLATQVGIIIINYIINYIISTTGSIDYSDTAVDQIMNDHKS